MGYTFMNCSFPYHNTIDVDQAFIKSSSNNTYGSNVDILIS